ncbi:citrate lyase alpha subunit [Bradyrhizobium sp. LB1.3]
MNTASKNLATQDASLAKLAPFAGANAQTPYLSTLDTKLHRKLCGSLEESIQRSGLKDGMTISFHHAFREGDKVVNKVVETLARLGFKNLTLASSSLLNCHDPLVEHIKNGVITEIYTSGMRGRLAEAVSNGLMQRPVQIHSHGGRVHLLQTGELKIDVAFLGVASCDEFGNANGSHGSLSCGSLGYAKVDAEYARQVVLLTQELVEFPNHPASISQDRVDLIVKVDQVGDPALISVGAARVTNNPRDLLIARHAADVIEHSGYFTDGFSLQTGSGASSTAATRFLEERMTGRDIKASFALGGITGSIAELHKKGLIKALVDVQSFDADAAESLRSSNAHIENLGQRICQSHVEGSLRRPGQCGYSKCAGDRCRLQRQRDHWLRRRDARRIRRTLRRRGGGRFDHRRCPTRAQSYPDGGAPGHHASDTR